MYMTYAIWFQNGFGRGWRLTEHTVKARTDKEAQSKVLRKFRNSEFTNMSLCAALVGIDPNTML